jgi:excisionase family DNA binding protein
MKLITAQEVADLTGIPRGSIYRMTKAKLIPTYRVGTKRRGVRYRGDEVLKALSEPAKQLSDLDEAKG